LRFRAACYRAHDPQWAFSPLSGEGAKLKGGRFNPKGVPALYLALTVQAMITETSHGFSNRFQPLTICTYDVDVGDIVDLRDDAGRNAQGVTLAELSCAWMDDVSAKRVPPSWQVASRLMASGAAGILVPSFAVGAAVDASNLVLWKWGPNLPHQVDVFDPSGRLPQNQLSWAAKP
jgi:RES domain-containing protein